MGRMKLPHLIENNLIECSYVEKMTDGKVPRIRIGAGLCKICRRTSCEFKPEESFDLKSGFLRNPDFRNHVRKLHKQGYSPSRIAKKLKVSRETVRRVLKELQGVR